MPENTLYGAVDTWVNIARPSTNYVAARSLTLDSGEAFAYIYFNRPVPLGATVISAKLRVYHTAAWTGSATITVARLNEQLRASQVNWNTRPAVTGTTASVTDPGGGADGTLVEIDVTTLLQDVANGATWRGLRLESTNTTARRIHSVEGTSAYRPTLYVEWSEAPQAPTNLSPSGNDAVSVAAPTVRFQVVDNLGDTTLAAAQVQVASDAAFTTGLWTSAWISTTEPQLNLATAGYPGMTAGGASVYWRVKVRDGALLESAWSQAAQMRRVAKGTVTITNPAATGSELMRNLVPNPSIETNTSFWANTKVTMTRDTTWSETGAASLKLNVSATDGLQYVFPYQDATQGPVNLRIGPVATGDYLSMRVRVRAIRNIRVRLYWTTYTSTGASAGWTSPTNDQADLTAGQVRTFELDNHVTGAGTGGNVVAAMLPIIALYDYQGSPSATQVSTTGDAIQVDGMMVVNSKTSPLAASLLPLAYWDGDTANTTDNQYAWLGTAHASLSVKRNNTPYVSEATPPFGWTFSGTQTAWRVRVYRPTNLVTPVLDSTRISTTETAWTPPSPGLPGSGPFTIYVDAWDNVDRDRGDEVATATPRTFMQVPDTTVTGVSSLTASQPNASPTVTLTWTRGTAPDSYTVKRNGETVAADLLPGDLLTGGTSYSWSDDGALPWQLNTYEVQAVVNSAASSPASVTITPQQRGIWLLDTAKNLRVWLAGEDGGTWERPEEATVYAPLGATVVTRRVQASRGYQGSLSGRLIDGYGRTAASYLADLETMRASPSRPVRLVAGDLSLRVLLGDVQTIPTTLVPPGRLVSFNFWQAS